MQLPLGAIFDMDGVIVHSNPVHQQAIKIFCEQHNLSVTEQFLRERVYGRTNKEWIPEVFGQISVDQSQKLADEKEQLFREMFTPEDHQVAGVVDFIHHLSSRDIPISLATSAPAENAKYILSRLNIKELFDTMLDSSHVEKGKPDPDIYLKASASIRQQPENCIVFEDSLAGVNSALKAGCSVIGVATTHTHSELASCHHVIDDFSGLRLEKIHELFKLNM